jgi:hypothetical protein
LNVDLAAHVCDRFRKLLPKRSRIVAVHATMIGMGGARRHACQRRRIAN